MEQPTVEIWDNFDFYQVFPKSIYSVRRNHFQSRVGKNVPNWQVFAVIVCKKVCA